MGASYRTGFPASGGAAWNPAARRAYRGGGGGGLDGDAAAYIASTGALHPVAVNALVLGIKAAGLWDDHIASIKLAIGVPNLAASLIDLRNPALNGAAYNEPAHSATEGWTFVSTDSTYIDTGWSPADPASKASQDDIHVGVRWLDGAPGFYAAGIRQNPTELAFVYLTDGDQAFRVNTQTQLNSSVPNPVPGHWILSRSNSTAFSAFMDGTSVTSGSSISNGLNTVPFFLGSKNDPGDGHSYSSGRAALFHAGASLTEQQAQDITEIFDNYAAAIEGA